MKKVNFQASLPVMFIRENSQFVAYTPALDLSTSGSSLKQARQRFVEAVSIFIDECLKMGTLSQVLTSLGWTKQKSEWNPPVIVAQDTQMINFPVLAQLMAGLVPIHWKKFEKFLSFVDCKLLREKGDHRIWGRAGLIRPIVLPKTSKIPIFVIRNNLRVLNVDVAEYLEIIRKI